MDARLRLRKLAEAPDLRGDPIEVIGAVNLEIGRSASSIDRTSKVELME